MRFVALLLSSLLVPAFCSAVEYPSHIGYVSDFADQLSPGDHQALESRLRAFERKTSVEVAVAIVPSLQGETVEAFATGLFRFWGIGKQGKNNGVLFLWTPNEHKVRIEVGYGLESAISNADAANILRETTALFREQHFAQGVEAAVSGILSRLDSSAAPPPPSGADSLNRAGLWLGAGLAGGIAIAAIALIYRRRKRMLQLQADVPQQIKALDASMESAESGLKQAVATLETMKGEAPVDVWSGISESLAAAPANLAKLREEAAAIRRQPRQEFAELRAASRRLRDWHARLSQQTDAFANTGAMLQDYRFRKQEASKLMNDIGATLTEFSVRYSAGELPGQAETLLPAARETYASALAAAAANPANWFLVYDLLTDVQECLDRIQNPYQWSRRPRCWAGSDVDSPALAAMAVLFSSWTPGRGNSGSDSDVGAPDFGGGGDAGSGGSDSGGSSDFGGGDSGGSGASDSY